MASDAFGSASDPLASPWASFGSFNTMRAVSGGCRNTGGSDADSGMRFGSSSVALSQADWVSGTTDAGPGVHMDSSGNGYIETAYNAAELFIFRLDAGSYTELGHVTGVYTAGQPNKIRTSGTDVIISKNGSDVLTVSDNTYRSGNPGLFAFAGNAIQDNWTDGAAGGYTLALDQGSYALTGQATALRADRRMGAAQGNYALNGQSVTLRMGRASLTAGQGSYALNGQSVTLAGPEVNYSLSMSQGSYTMIGSDAAADFAMSVGSGSYALNGNPVGLAYGHKAGAGQGSYALNGQAVSLRAARRITISPGAYALTGRDVGLAQHDPTPVLTAETGLYSITGQQVGLIGPPRVGGDIFNSIPLTWWTKGA